MTESDVTPEPGCRPDRGRSPIDVAVNLLWCVPGEVGGSEQYLVRQLVGLGLQRAEFAPTLYCLPAFVDAHPELAGLYPMVAARISGDHRPRRIVAEHTWLRRRTGSAELVHHGGGTAPAGRTSPVRAHHPRPAVPARTRSTSSAAKRALPRHAAIPRSVRAGRRWSRCRPSTCDARSSTRTAPHRSGSWSCPTAANPRSVPMRRRRGELRRDYGLGAGRVVVYPAITHPHKGHAFLRRADGPTLDDPDLRLVLLGGPGSAEGEVDRDDRPCSVVGRPDRAAGSGAGRRSQRSARDGDALVFPSEYEGFGAPLIEAMALGTPVICSDQPCTRRRWSGDAGIVLPAATPTRWAGALDEVGRRGATSSCAPVAQRVASFTSTRSGEAPARRLPARVPTG